MAQNDFSFRRFFHVAHAGSVAAGILIGLIAGPGGAPAEMVLRAIAGGACGLMASGCLYLLLVLKDLAALQIPTSELNEHELVLLKSAGSMIHYKSGRPLRFWEGVGGRLFLTNEVLEFRAHRGQAWVYRLTIPLGEIAAAAPTKILGILPGGLRVERKDGSFELFTFGALRKDNDSESWATAILAVQTASSLQ
ncbi:MAG TPA: hypothetical protein VMG10_01850 [Gemmataceae bacterium]|nr:hypothetical protein [Gemmataceae bacterium]